MRCTPPKLRWFKELRDLNPATNCKLGYALCARCERCRVSLTVTFVQSENPTGRGSFSHGWMSYKLHFVPIDASVT